MRLLDPVALGKVGTLALRARTIVDGALAGLHRSPHYGSSVEFAEHKEYTPGDEIRHLDWKAWGRLDRFYVKRFERETELDAYLVLDSSGSMGYGPGAAAGRPTKLEYAAQLAASLAYLLIRQQDKVGLFVAGGRDSVYVPPRARPTHLHDLLAQLEGMLAAGARGPTTIAAALDRIAERAGRRRSLVVVLSDLFDRSPELPRMLRRLRVMRHDVAVLQILDPDELDLPFEGVTLFESLEDDRRVMADPEKVRAAYLTELGGFLDSMRSACRDGGVEYHLVSTRDPLERTLADFLTRGRSGWSSSHR